MQYAGKNNFTVRLYYAVMHPRVAKFVPKVGSRRTTKILFSISRGRASYALSEIIIKIFNLVVLDIILVVLILLPYYMQVVLVLILLFFIGKRKIT